MMESDLQRSLHDIWIRTVDLENQPQVPSPWSHTSRVLKINFSWKSISESFSSPSSQSLPSPPSPPSPSSPPTDAKESKISVDQTWGFDSCRKMSRQNPIVPSISSAKIDATASGEVGLNFPISSRLIRRLKIKLRENLQWRLSIGLTARNNCNITYTRGCYGSRLGADKDGPSRALNLVFFREFVVTQEH